MRTLVDEGVDDGSAAPDSADAPRRSAVLAALGVAAAVAVGAALRFVSTSALWLDEALSVNIASLAPGDILEALRHDGHPPLYYLLLHYWMELVGDGDTVVRALSGLIGVATLPFAWVAGRRIAGTAGARWSVVVLALSPYAIRYSSETRMYSLVMLLSLVGYLLVDDALRPAADPSGNGADRRSGPTPLRLAGIALVSGLLLLTHYWSFYLLGTVGLLLVLRWWRVPATRRATLRVILAIAAGGLLFLPWLGGFLYQGSHTGTPWGSPYRPTELVQSTLNDLGGGVFSEAFLSATVTLFLLTLALMVVRASRTELVLDLRTTPLVRRELAVALGTLALGCVAGYATNAAYQSRYAAVVVPLVLLGVAAGLTRLVGVARLAVAAFWVVLAFAGVVWLQTYERTQAPDAAAAIAAQAEPGDVVVYCPDQLGPAYSRALDAEGLDVVHLAYPELGDPQLVDWVDYADRNGAADPVALAEEVRLRAEGHGIFVVWMGEYQTFGDQCERLVGNLGRGEQLLGEDSAGFYEPANVHWFPAGRADAAPTEPAGG
jgi:uncharacterized membrane protein